MATQRTRTNRLAGETSPYLLQHAHNPVDWYPWGEEALSRARAEDKPIFLSIGYAACHWCHVMERESFEDEATAGQLNRDFVSIKVDREERPDLDAIYMDAVQAMTGQGGWPMSVFLTPDGAPFYGGTYFPNERRHGMPAFRDVLDGLTRAWREKRADVERTAHELAAAIATEGRGTTANAQAGTGADGATSADTAEATDGSTRAAGSLAGLPAVERSPAFGLELLDAAMVGLERSFDAENGGWGNAPKFPQAMTIEFLLRQHHRTGDARALAMARRTLDRMAAGGIYDHLGGGFARYATDAHWLVPHFEKMLYDNAQLARVYLHAYQLTGERRYRAVVEETLEYVAREMRLPEGAFAASQDADTEGEEGATYVWSETQINEALREDAPLFKSAYGVTPVGNWEGHTILSRVRDDESLAASYDLTPEAVAARLDDARGRLLERRAARPQPARDDKALTAWNGLMLAPFAEASRALDRPEYGEVAVRAADFLLDSVRTEDWRLRRSWKDGRALHNGVLEDYTHFADGLLAVYEASFEDRFFAAARALIDVVLERFADPAGGFFDTSDDHERLLTRPKGLQDNALPSGNAMAAVVLLRLTALTGEARYRDAAERTLALVAPAARRYPTAFAWWLVGMDLAATGLNEVAVVGEPDAPDTAALLAVAFGAYRPRQVVAASARPDASAVPLLHDRAQLNGRATAYVCRNFACQKPVTDPAALAAQLG